MGEVQTDTAIMGVFLKERTKDRRNTRIQGRTYRQEAYAREIQGQVNQLCWA